MPGARDFARRVRNRVIAPPVRTLMRVLLGSDVVQSASEVRSLEQRLAETQRLVELLADDPHKQWLYRHRMERMDATVDLFDAARRKFHLARYEFSLPYVEGRDVADIACGTGYGTELLKVRGGARTCLGVDIDAQAIEYASACHQQDGGRYVCAAGDATGLPNESVDVLVSFETIEHVPSDASLLAEFQRILRPGGVLICSTPNNWPLEFAPHHVRLYDRRSFECTLAECFKEIALHNQNSGTQSRFNHEQAEGIVPTTAGNESVAECLIAVCRRK